MQITYLVLENFKSYRQRTRIDFRPGTNAIIGANGAGKSSMLEAIGFALFDSQPPGFKLANLLSEGTKSGLVVVGLMPSDDERVYEVERAFSERATTRYRVLDPSLGSAILAESNADVAAWLHTVLRIAPGVDLAYLFAHTVGVPQGTFTAPFLLAPGTRKEIFDPLLRVDEYRHAGQNLRDTERVLRERSDEWENSISHMEGELAQLPRDRAELRVVEARLESLSGRIAESEADLAGRQDELLGLDDLKGQLDDAQQKLQSVRAAQLLEESRLVQAERLLSEASDAQAQVEKALPGYQAYGEAEGELSLLEGQRRERDRLQGERQSLEIQLVTQTARDGQLRAELSEMATAQARVEVLAPLVARQVELQSQLDAAQRDSGLLDEARAQRQRVEDERAQTQSELEAVQVEMATAQAREADLPALNTHLTEISSEERAALASLASARSERERLAEQSATLSATDAARCPVCEAELTAQHRDDLIARNTLQIASLGREADEGESALSALRGDRARSESRRGELERELRQLRTEADRQRAAERFSRLDADLSQAQDRERLLSAAPELVGSLRAELDALGDPRREDQLRRDKLARRDLIESAHRAASEQVDALSTAVAALTGDLEALAWLDQAIDRAQAARAEHRPAYERTMQHLAAAGQLDERTTQSAVARCRAQAAQVAVEHATRQHAQIADRYDPAFHAHVRSDHQRLSIELAGARAQLDGDRERQGALYRQIGELEQLERGLAQARDEHQRVTEMRSVLRTVRDLLVQAGPHVTRQLVYHISRQASTIYADIMNDHAGRLNWSQDYELSLEVKGRQRTFQQLSGGEQMSASLALRLALLRETSAIDVAFFDEPTAHLDPQRREGLAERIMEVKGFSQIFVISHDDTFERAAQNFIRVVRDVDGSRLEVS